MRSVAACVVIILFMVSFVWVKEQRGNFPVKYSYSLGEEPIGETACGKHITGLSLRINGWPCISFCPDDSGHTVIGSSYHNNMPNHMVFVNKGGISKSGFMFGTTWQIVRWRSKYAGATLVSGVPISHSDDVCRGNGTSPSHQSLSPVPFAVVVARVDGDLRRTGRGND